jgi:transposase
MSYRQTNIGLMIRLDPKKAKAELDEAYKKVKDKPGKADENVAEYLGVGKSTVRRLVAQLADAGLEVKKPNIEEKAQPAKTAQKRRA